MPRDIPVGNGQMLVAFDHHYQIRDLYFPHVGQENHVNGAPCRFGVYGQIKSAPHDRRRRRLFWSPQGWELSLNYHPDTLATHVTMRHRELSLQMVCCDVVDFNRPVLVRRIDLINLTDEEREVRLFHHNDFHMYGTKVGDTAYYDPQLRALIHYRNARYLMVNWYVDGEPRLDEFATGVAGFGGAEGTWRDAEDGVLGNNPIAQGAVDSTIMVQAHLPPAGKRTVYMVIGAGKSRQDLEVLHRFMSKEGPQGVIERTKAYWRLWLDASRVRFPSSELESHGPSEKVRELFKRSLLVVRTQIDNTGAIIAANDSDIMQFSRDTYSYLWPRDGAMVADAMDAAGFPDVARNFFSLCTRIIQEQGYFLHKYCPDGSPASSWHPWSSLGRPQLPIQEDETALVLWALWRHFERYRDIEFVRHLWSNLIVKAADFMVNFRDPDTHLPLPSYDLWEERWGVNAHTVATVHAGLTAAYRFADSFGDQNRARIYKQAADQVKAAFCKYMWSPKHDRFLRRIVPLDHPRTARQMAEVMAGKAPQPDHLVADTPEIGMMTPEQRALWENERAAKCQQGRLQTLLTRKNNGHELAVNNMDFADAKAPCAMPGQSEICCDAAKAPGMGCELHAHARLAYEYDTGIDAALLSIATLGLLDLEDPRLIKTIDAVESRLKVRTDVGGIARYENDYYHRMSDDIERIPGNPWFICTLWMAEWRIMKAKTRQELEAVLPVFEWVANHALPSGILAEQVHPLTNAPLSVSPLTWSHATVVSALEAYMTKWKQMHLCPTCGQAVTEHHHPHEPLPVPSASRRGKPSEKTPARSNVA